MSHRMVVNLSAAGILFAASAAPSATLTVIRPTASTVIPAGDDYATQVLGNAWDMNDDADIDTEESLYVVSQTFASGIFSGTTTATGSNIYPLFMGYASSINLSRGANHPIDTSHYRYVTYKLRVNQPTQPQFTRVVGVLDGGSYGATPKSTVVEAFYTSPLPNNVWTIVTFDMVTNNDGLYYQWTDFPQLTGLRIDPASTNAAPPYVAAPFGIAWIRLTAPATAAQKYTVQWTDSGYSGTYSIAAIDSGGVNYALGSGISGTSYAADMTFLEPGAYTIMVARSDSSATANSGTFHINTPPEITVTAPSASGDLTKDFAKTIVGNQWGPITAPDFPSGYGVRNFTNVSYTNPAGSFYGRPLNFDPGWFFNLGGQTIDTSVYRSLCYTMEVFGPRSVGLGSIARVFWGNSTGAVSTSLAIPLDDNVNDSVVGNYCIADLAAYPPDPTATNYGSWSGTKSVFRIDPDEFTPPNGCNTRDPCHDVQLNSVTLSPFALANPSYTFKWSLTDPDNAGDTVDVYLDPDTTPLNGNEIHLNRVTAVSGTGQFAWAGSCANALTYGPWHVLTVVSDGINPVSRYAVGPLLVDAYDGIFRNGFESIPSLCP